MTITVTAAIIIRPHQPIAVATTITITPRTAEEIKDAYRDTVHPMLSRFTASKGYRGFEMAKLEYMSYIFKAVAKSCIVLTDAHQDVWNILEPLDNTIAVARQKICHQAIVRRLQRARQEIVEQYDIKMVRGV